MHKRWGCRGRNHFLLSIVRLKGKSICKQGKWMDMAQYHAQDPKISQDIPRASCALSNLVDLNLTESASDFP